MRGIELTPDEPVEAVVRRGVAAAREGFDALFVSAHYNNRDPFAVLARLAARTDDVRLAPGIANPFETHPVSLASRVATVDEQSDGRALFGIGAGDPSTLSNLGLAGRRGVRPVLETIQVARALWAGERVHHDGTFRADQAGLNYEVSSDIPVFVGGEGPDMCRMAGKHADGLLFNAATPSDLAWARERVHETRENGDGDGFTLAAYACVSVAPDPSEARRAARRPVAFIAAGASEAVLDRHRLSAETADRIADRIAAGAFGVADDLVTEEMIDSFAVAGDRRFVQDRFASLLEYADSIVVGAPLGPDPDRAVELAGRALAEAEGSHSDRDH